MPRRLLTLFFLKLSIELFARSSLSSQVSGSIAWILILAYQGADLSYLIDPSENPANLIAPSKYQQTKRNATFLHQSLPFWAPLLEAWDFFNGKGARDKIRKVMGSESLLDR